MCWEAMAWCDEGNEMLLEEVMVRVVLAQRGGGDPGSHMGAHEEDSRLGQDTQKLGESHQGGVLEKKRTVREDLRAFYSMKEELYELEEVPFLHGHMLIPAMLRKQVLDIWGGTHRVLDAHHGWEVEAVQIDGEI